MSDRREPVHPFRTGRFDEWRKLVDRLYNEFWRNRGVPKEDRLSVYLTGANLEQRPLRGWPGMYHYKLKMEFRVDGRREMFTVFADEVGANGKWDEEFVGRLRAEIWTMLADGCVLREHEHARLRTEAPHDERSFAQQYIGDDGRRVWNIEEMEDDLARRNANPPVSQIKALADPTSLCALERASARKLRDIGNAEISLVDRPARPRPRQPAGEIFRREWVEEAKRKGICDEIEELRRRLQQLETEAVGDAGDTEPAIARTEYRRKFQGGE